MAKFSLKWLSAVVLVNPASQSITAWYRKKITGGNFISTGFLPANDLPTYTEVVTSPELAENIVWEFKVQTNCSNGTVENTNGIQEGLKFKCFVPVVTHDIISSSITINVSGTDISKAGFTLKKASDNSVVYGPVIKTGTNSISASTGNILTGSTEYYWETQLFAIVNGVEISSSSPAPFGLGSPCVSDSFTTDPDVCLPVTSMEISSIEI